MSQPEPGPNPSPTSRPRSSTGVAREGHASQPEQLGQSEPAANVASAATNESNALRTRSASQLSPVVTAAPHATAHSGFQSLLNAATGSMSGGAGQDVPHSAPEDAVPLSGRGANPSQLTSSLSELRQGVQSPQQQPHAQQDRSQHAGRQSQESSGAVATSFDPASGFHPPAVNTSAGYAASQGYTTRLSQPTAAIGPHAPPQYQAQTASSRYAPMPPPGTGSAHSQSPAFESHYRFPPGPDSLQNRTRSPHYPLSSAHRERAPHSASPERQAGRRYESESSPGGYSYAESQGMSFQIDVQGASRVADEKRRRNAGASARFRARRKEKEQQNSREIDDLKRKIRDLEEDSDFYRRERDYFVAVLYNGPDRDRHFPRAPSPRRLRIRHGPEDSYPSYEEHGQPGAEGRSARRRLTGDYHGELQGATSASRSEAQLQQQQQQYAPPSQYGPPPPTAQQPQGPYAQQTPHGAQAQYYYPSSQPQPPPQQGPSYTHPSPYGPPHQSRQPPPPPATASSGQAVPSQRDLPTHHTPTNSGSGPGSWQPSQPGKRAA